VESTSAITMMEQIRKNEIQKAAMSLSKRVCEAQDISFEDIVEKVKLLYLNEDEFPEAKGLIEVIKESCLDATSVVSFIMADDFRSQSPRFVVPTEQPDYLENKVKFVLH
jgi:hypothetical protein